MSLQHLTSPFPARVGLMLQGMEQTSYVVDDFVREWKKVWEAVACLPNFASDIKGRLLVDLSNEPDSQWQGWQVKNGKAGELPSWCKLHPGSFAAPKLSCAHSTQGACLTPARLTLLPPSAAAFASAFRLH